MNCNSLQTAKKNKITTKETEKLTKRDAEMLTKKEIGNKIRNYRKQTLGIKSQLKAARMIGIPQPSLSAWESGKREPNLNAIIKISQTYGVSIEDLFDLPLAGVGAAKKIFTNRKHVHKRTFFSKN